MSSAIHTPSPRVMTVSSSLADLVKAKHNHGHLIIRKLSNQEGYNKVLVKKFRDHRQKQNHRGEFRGWCMPEETPGYIKASKHNLL